MKSVKKPVFFIVFFILCAFTASVFLGVSTKYGDIETIFIKGTDEIRWGIDIRGGVDVTFTPPEDFDATNEQMDSAKEVIMQRLLNLGIADSECYVDYNKDRIIVRFPWKVGETDFNPEQAINELGETALLTFREGAEQDAEGKPSGVTASTIILEGKDVVNAYPSVDENNNYVVGLEFSAEGATAFGEATKRLAQVGQISIWMDETCISTANVNEVIPNGKASISGNFDRDEVVSLANKINSGALPFKLVTSSFSTISPTLGMGARDAMVLSALIALIIVAIYIVCLYRLPGAIAVIALIGHIAGTLACVTGYFGFMNGNTLTVPGIAGIILSIGMGVDANIITAERIKEEVNAGKTIDGAIASGYKRAFTAIFDGNITVIIVAVILMGSFGPPDSIFAKMLSWVFFMFGPSTAGTIYSFGFTLLVGVILNFIMGVTASRLMLSSISKFKAFRNPVLYGGAKKNENV